MKPAYMIALGLIGAGLFLHFRRTPSAVSLGSDRPIVQSPAIASPDAVSGTQSPVDFYGRFGG